MKGGRFGTITTGENGDVAALVAQFASEFLHDGCFAGAADGQVADGDDLDAESRVAQDADIVKESPDFNGDLKELRAAVKQTANESGPGSAPFFQNDLEDKGL